MGVILKRRTEKHFSNKKRKFKKSYTKKKYNARYANKMKGGMPKGQRVFIKQHEKEQVFRILSKLILYGALGYISADVVIQIAKQILVPAVIQLGGLSMPFLQLLMDNLHIVMDKTANAVQSGLAFGQDISSVVMSGLKLTGLAHLGARAINPFYQFLLMKPETTIRVMRAPSQGHVALKSLLSVGRDFGKNVRADYTFASEEMLKGLSKCVWPWDEQGNQAGVHSAISFLLAQLDRAQTAIIDHLDNTAHLPPDEKAAKKAAIKAAAAAMEAENDAARADNVAWFASIEDIIFDILSTVEQLATTAVSGTCAVFSMAIEKSTRSIKRGAMMAQEVAGNWLAYLEDIFTAYEREGTLEETGFEGLHELFSSPEFCQYKSNSPSPALVVKAKSPTPVPSAAVIHKLALRMSEPPPELMHAASLERTDFPVAAAKAKSPFPAKAKSPSPVAKAKSPSPAKAKSPSPAKAKSPSPAKAKTPSPVAEARRSTSAAARRSKSVAAAVRRSASIVHGTPAPADTRKRKKRESASPPLVVEELPQRKSRSSSRK